MAEINLNPTVDVRPTPISAQPIVPISELGAQRGPAPSEVFRQTYEDRAAVAEANNRRIQAEQTMRKLKADAAVNTAPLGRQIALERRLKGGGNVPYNADGTPNWDQIDNEDRTYTDTLWRNTRIAAITSGLDEYDIVEQDSKTGKYYKVKYWVPKLGEGKPREAARFEIPPPEGAAGKSMTPGQQAALIGEVSSLKQYEQELNRMLQIVTDPNKNVVGPNIGSAAGRLFVWLESQKDPARRNDQRTLTVGISRAALQKANEMKGPLSEKELAFLLRAVPMLTDDEGLWRSWISSTLKSVQAAHAEKKLILDSLANNPSYDPQSEQTIAERKSMLASQGIDVDQMKAEVDAHAAAWAAAHPNEAEVEGLSSSSIGRPNVKSNLSGVTSVQELPVPMGVEGEAAARAAAFIAKNPGAATAMGLSIGTNGVPLFRPSQLQAWAASNPEAAQRLGFTFQ